MVAAIGFHLLDVLLKVSRSQGPRVKSLRGHVLVARWSNGGSELGKSAVVRGANRALSLKPATVAV